jgi:hypothetical protein
MTKFPQYPAFSLLSKPSESLEKDSSALKMKQYVLTNRRYTLVPHGLGTQNKAIDRSLNAMTPRKSIYSLFVYFSRNSSLMGHGLLIQKVSRSQMQTHRIR